MKNFYIILSLLFLVSCSSYKKIEIFNKSYSSSNYSEMMKDVYWYLDTFNSDSIPISEWLFMQRYTDEGYQIERLYQKRLDRKTEFLFLIDTYVSDSINYKFSILMRTKEKKYK